MLRFVGQTPCLQLARACINPEDRWFKDHTFVVLHFLYGTVLYIVWQRFCTADEVPSVSYLLPLSHRPFSRL